MGGQWFKPFARTIACSVLVSLFVSFSLDPMLSAHWPDPHRPPEERGWITRILLIDFAKWARARDGLPLREALIQAGAIRVRPILMTTFALSAGMIPVALGRGEGAQFRQPLGVAVIGGTITSTLLTLLVIPTVYEIFDEIRR